MDRAKRQNKLCTSDASPACFKPEVRTFGQIRVFDSLSFTPGCHPKPPYFACSLTWPNSHSVLRLGFKCWQLALPGAMSGAPLSTFPLGAEHSATMNGMNIKPSARKTHRKTRTGCRTCKSRKIKVRPVLSPLHDFH
jgi:hypothetical protein